MSVSVWMTVYDSILWADIGLEEGLAGLWPEGWERGGGGVPIASGAKPAFNRRRTTVMTHPASALLLQLCYSKIIH
jgi:hypothetical protein